jgi:dimethylhistidine N-methyltransferase
MNFRIPRAGHRDGSRSSPESFTPGVEDVNDPDDSVADRRTDVANLAPVLDFMPPADDVRAAVLDGLSHPQKRLACKFLYDDAGSRLFDRICDLPEYYPTRTELRITRECAGEIAGAIGPDALLVEYGSGSSLKTRLLLDHLSSPAGYAPIDISRGHLVRSARQLAAAYPHVPILPVCADYTRPLRLPHSARRAARVVAYFPGSTIGNFEPDEAAAFLHSIRTLCGPGSGLLIGVDLKKDPATLHAAYNDTAGVTAAFNLNLLTRINRELGGDFDLSRFAHHAFYHVPRGRIEMHLVSLARQTVRVGDDAEFAFDEGETVHTENCYKYTIEGFTDLARGAGYRPVRVWTDTARRFSLHYLAGE